MSNKLERLLLAGAFAGSLMFSLGKAVAQNQQAQPFFPSQQTQQQYEPCDTANPNYCTECRDESNRDFARCGEIDYRDVNVLVEKPIINE